MKVGQRVKFTNEAGVEYEALVTHVHRDEEHPPIDLVHVDPSVHLPNGPAAPIHRFEIPHASGAFVKGKPQWSEPA